MCLDHELLPDGADPVLIIQFDPYGAATRTDGTIDFGGTTQNPYTYAGGLQDRATGNIKFGARYYDPTLTRYYDPTLTRFTQPDPAQQGPNLYTYAGDDPTNNTDPTGMFSFGNVFDAAVSGFVTGFVGGLVVGCLDSGCITSLPGALLGAVGGFFAGGVRRCADGVVG